MHTGGAMTLRGSESGDMESRHRASPGWRAWAIFVLGAVTFSFAFFQRVAPSVMVQDLMREFAVGAAVLGNLSALYFYAYAGLQIPIGVMVDRWGARAILTLALLLAAIGSAIFATATFVEIAYVGRLLIGTGSAAGFVATLTLASRWFPPHRYAFFAGLTMLFGMAGGFLGQAPLSRLVEWIGWRPTQIGAAVFALALATTIWLFVRNAPPGDKDIHGDGHDGRGMMANLALVLANGRVWIIALVGMTLSSPLLAFGGLWGVPYMMVRYDLTRPEAALVTSLLLIGWAAGAPTGGWLSDHIGRRKLPLLLATGFNTALLVLFFHGPALPLWAALIVIFLFGANGSMMVICYAFSREYSAGRAQGSVTGFVNMMTVAAGALFQPIVGLLLDMRWSGAMANGAPVYTLATYNFAFSSLIVAALLGLIGAMIPPETYCRAVTPRSA